jgi:hypothetical protein
MRKLIIFFILLLIIWPTFAQTPYWTEDFSVGEEWSLDENWIIDGGKLEFNWSPAISNFDVSAVSQIITLHESIGELIVNQYLDVFSNSPDEVAEISIMYDGNEDILWSHALSNGSWGSYQGEDIEFSLTEYAGMDVQFKFRTYGESSYNWNWWDVFSMTLTVYLDQDLSVSEISGPTQVDLMETGTWTFDVRNTGSQVVSGFTVKLFDYKTGELIGNIMDPGEIDPAGSYSYSFDWQSSAAYNTVFYGMVEFEGDEFTGNNVSQSHFVRVNPDIDFNILVWDNDNEIPTLTCPEQGDEIDPSTGLTRALDAAEYEYDYFYYLPENLNSYDIVFSTMGCFCVS